MGDHRSFLKPLVLDKLMPRKIVTYTPKEEQMEHEEGLESDVEDILDAPSDEE